MISPMIMQMYYYGKLGTTLASSDTNRLVACAPAADYNKGMAFRSLMILY
jgi:hypothetical protein